MRPATAVNADVVHATSWVEEIHTFRGEGYCGGGERRFFPPGVGLGIEQIECAAARMAQRSRASDSNKHGCFIRNRNRYQIK
jgi:hypothetical protein